MIAKFLSASAIVCLMICWIGHADATEEWEKGVKLIKTQEVKKLCDEKADFLLINALSPLEFRDTTIPGSINMPYEHLKEGKVQLPADKNKMLVFF